MDAGRLLTVTPLVFLCFLGAHAGTHDVLSLCFDKNMADGIYTHPTDCTMFIECSGFITSELDCPANLVFNPDLKVCDDPNRVVGGNTCMMTTTPPPTTTTTDFTSTPRRTRPTTTTMQTTTTTIPPTTTTTRPTTTTTMPTTTTTMPTTITTMPTTTTTTDFTSTPRRTRPTTTTMPTTTTKSSAAGTLSTIDISNLCVDQKLTNGIHPDPSSCVHFIECSFGQTYQVPCPSGLYFNSKALTCDDRFNVDCKDNYNYIVG